MEVERSTDGAVRGDDDAVGTTAVGSTDTTTASVGVVDMEGERPTDGAAGLGRDVTGVTTIGPTDTVLAMGRAEGSGRTGEPAKKKRKQKGKKRGGSDRGKGRSS